MSFCVVVLVISLIIKLPFPKSRSIREYKRRVQIFNFRAIATEVKGRTKIVAF